MTSFNLPLPPASALADHLRALDWGATDFGPVERWPQHLRTTVGIVVASRQPMVVLWGDELLQIYNDGYADLLGRKHPRTLGRPARECWPELWETISPLFESVRRTAQAVSFENFRLDIDRNGNLEECYFTFCWSPVFGDGNRVDGIFASAIETTDGVVGARRNRILREVAETPFESLEPEECVRRCLAPVRASPDDVAFAEVYLRTSDGAGLRRVAGSGEPPAIDLTWAGRFDGALRTRKPCRVPWPAPGEREGAPGAASEALVLPILCSPPDDAVGVLVAGLNPRRPNDAASEQFLSRLALQLGTTLARARDVERVRQDRIDVLERMTDCFYALDRDWRVTYLNAAAERYIGRSREELLGMKLFELFPGSKGTRFEHECQRSMRELVPVQFESLSTVTGGWVEVHAYPSPAGLSVFFQDIAERREAEEARRQLTEIIEATPDLVGISDPHGRTKFLNRAGRSMLGFGEDEDLSHLPISAYIDAESYERTARPGAHLAIRDGSWWGESVFKRRDGRTFPVSQVILAHRSPSGELAFLSTIARDVTEQRRAEERLRESEERYRTVFEHNSFPMWLYDQDTLAFVAVNQAAVERYGYSREEFLRMTIRDIRAASEIPNLFAGLERVRNGQRVIGTFAHRRKDGRPLQVELSVHNLVIGGRTLGLVHAHDVTERKQLESQLRQAQKMEAVGQLAGGIAHDFNNLLAVMGSYTRLALAETAPGSQLNEDLREVEAAVSRAAGLTRRLLAFSRQQPLTLESLDLNHVVTDAERMLRRVIREDVLLVTKLEPALEPIHADRGQLEQLLLNLAVNARDAMPSGGTLTIETARVAPEEPPAALGAATQGCARLVVRDTGHGMDEVTRSRIFEPFFTTKPVGKGTGLGLSSVYGVIKQLGGHIEVTSAPGAGTAFTIDLPFAREAAERGPPAASKNGLPPAFSGHETVLVVEDEPAVRQSVRRVLETYGLTVLEAGNGQEALAVLEPYAGRVHLVLTDVVMPVMGGRELVQRVRERWPEIGALLMSGYDPGASEHAEDVLPKPFRDDELLRRIREALPPAAATRVSLNGALLPLDRRGRLR